MVELQGDVRRVVRLDVVALAPNAFPLQSEALPLILFIGRSDELRRSLVRVEGLEFLLIIGFKLNAFGYEELLSLQLDGHFIRNVGYEKLREELQAEEDPLKADEYPVMR